MEIPLKDCNQCSHYRGGFCYGFGVAKQVFSTAEAIICGNYTPLGQVQIGPLESLAGQLKAIQIPDGIISTLKLADLAVSTTKLANASVTALKIANAVIADVKIAADAAIAESKLDLNFATHARYTDVEAVAAIEAEDPLELAGTLKVSNIINSGAINLKPSGDLDDYLEFYTSGNEVRLKRIGGRYLFIESDDAAYAGLQINDDGTNYAMLRYNKGAHQFEFYSPQTYALTGGTKIRLIPSGDYDNYIEFSTSVNIPKIDAIGANKIQLDGVDVSAHAENADAHHIEYTDAEAVAAIEALAQLNLSGNLKIGGGHIKDSGGNSRIQFLGDETYFKSTTARKMDLTGTQLLPYTDHLLDLGSEARAWDTLYRQSEVTTSFEGVFENPIELTKAIKWDKKQHLNHKTLPELIRTLRIKEKDKETKKVSDTHYDVDGMQMLMLQTIQKLIKRIEVLEGGSVKFRN